MSNYSPTGNPVSQTRGTSSLIRSEFLLIQTALNSKADPTVANTFTAANIFNALNTFNAGMTVTGAANFTGAVLTAATQAQGDNSTKVATTAYADTGLSFKANLASPTFTGTPAAPTPAAADNSTTIATTAHVKAALATMPSGSLPAIVGNANKALVVNSGGSGVQWANPSLLSVAYASRANLRSIDGPAGVQAVIDAIGVFQWVSASTARDDDETAFVTASGAWELIAAGPEWVQLLVDAETEDLRLELQSKTSSSVRVLRSTFAMSVTSVAANTATMVASSVTILGAVIGDPVVVSFPTIPGSTNPDIAALVIKAFVLANDTVVVYLTNPTAATANLSAATWTVSVIKQ